jgi:SAM-dependent methyltransferase
LSPRYAKNRPDDVHRASPGHRYRHYISTFPAALERCAAELGVAGGDRIVDYGCAELPYRHFFPVDVEYVAADLPGNPHATVEINADGSLPLEDDSCNALISTQVLEHVDDPALYLAECFRVLRSGGRMMLSTHGVFIYHPDPGDYWRWTLAGLRKILENAGFAIRHEEGVIGLAATGLQLFQEAVYYRLPRLLMAPFAFVMQSVIALADRLQGARSKRWNASVFIVIAEKP